LLTGGWPTEELVEDKDADFLDFETEKLSGVLGWGSAYEIISLAVPKRPEARRLLCLQVRTRTGNA
jgi:hypothetical protein